MKKKYSISCKAKWTKTGFTQAFEGDIFEGKSKKEAIEKNLHCLWAIAMGNGWHCNVDYDKKQFVAFYPDGAIRMWYGFKAVLIKEVAQKKA